MDEAAVGSSAPCACEPACPPAAGAGAPQELTIVWQRLVAAGETCPRCGTTRDALRAAVEALTGALGPLGITPRLEERALDPTTFAGSPAESNRIWIAGRPLEDWLGATAGASRCCSVCGSNDCRTLEVDGASFDAVPERLIIKAALAAASATLAV